MVNLQFDMNTGDIHVECAGGIAQVIFEAGEVVSKFCEQISSKTPMSEVDVILGIIGQVWNNASE